MVDVFCDWQVGFTDEGKLNGVKIFFYADCGASPNENSVANMYSWLDNGELIAVISQTTEVE